ALFAGHDQGPVLLRSSKPQAAWHRSATTSPTCSQARQSLARFANRRTHALDLGSRALHQQFRGMTPPSRAAPPPPNPAKNQAVRAVRSKRPADGRGSLDRDVSGGGFGAPRGGYHRGFGGTRVPPLR